ncbi:MAG: hypothetical protein PHC61_09010 [Chitinivibrionales bacterium]|nr:hypothetical protein [Chitinivibrionales bacterium]
MLFALSAFMAINAAAAEKKQQYLQQSYIDSLIQTALYRFSEVIYIEGFDSEKRRAIDYATWVVATLRRQALGDPNLSYVNWKTGELEDQILLEKNDIILEKAHLQLKVKNALIDSFNAEVTKRRPDFAALNRLLRQMETMDANKARATEAIIFERRAIYSKVLPVRINRALENDALEQARADLDYCAVNQGFLSIPRATLQDLQGDLAARMSALNEQKAIPKDLSSCEKYLADRDLGRFFRLSDDIRTRLNAMKASSSPIVWGRCRMELEKLLDAARRFQDSLVLVNCRLITNKEINKALDYRDYLKRQIGVSSDKIAQIDDALMAVSVQTSSKGVTAMGEIVKRLTDTTAENNFSFSDLLVQARRKAQRQADSAKDKEQRDLRAAQLQEIGTTAFFFFPKNEAQIARELKRNEEMAYAEIELIYKLLEQNNFPEACRMFAQCHKKLQLFTCKESFATLEATLKQMAGGGRPAAIFGSN